MYQRDTEDVKYKLLQDFYQLQFKKEVDMRSNIAELENITHKLRGLKQEITDEMKITKLLSILPNTYKYFRSAWESASEKDKTFEKLTGRLLNEELRMKSENTTEQVAFKGEQKRTNRHNKPDDITCFCGRMWKKRAHRKKLQKQTRMQYLQEK
ncbi:uncharacterized protein [Onthophagus taurus]|uniref:uncharacterized protein n=1 Tax=Onthophagus taurus TaxID=166361 RepID=UPI0039BDA8F9